MHGQTQIKHNNSIQNASSEVFVGFLEIIFLSEINYNYENAFIGAVFKCIIAL